MSPISHAISGLVPSCRTTQYINLTVYFCLLVQVVLVSVDDFKIAW
ncbi:hypothetical protein [Rickettsia endosymbiont of Polydrusus tereticollis]